MVILTYVDRNLSYNVKFYITYSHMINLLCIGKLIKLLRFIPLRIAVGNKYFITQSLIVKCNFIRFVIRERGI